MPLSRQDAERGLNLLWEFLSVASASECTQGFSQAISGLHLFLTDVLPASQPCIRAKVEGGFIEIRPRANTPVRLVDLEVALDDKLGIVLDSINVEGVSGVSPIVVSLVSPGSVAAHDGRLGRGDQLLEINGHSLRLATLARARWLLDSAARKGTVSLATLPFALLDGLKHSVSRQDMLSLTLAPKHKRSRSLENINRIWRKGHAHPSSSHHEVKRSKTDVATRNRPLVTDSRYTPSIGSRSSNRSVVSNTVEVAAHLARTSVASTKTGFGAFKKRKVRKMHIMKESSGLGIRVVGGKGSKLGDMGIFVNQLEERGAANKDGRLKPGDELLMVDGKSLVGLTHTEAVDVLKSTQRLVQLVVATEDDGHSCTSSVQSIPELFSGRKKSQTSHDIAPEIPSNPNRHAFEMKLLGGGELSKPQSRTAETGFTESTSVHQSDEFQIIRTVTSWGKDSEPLSPLPEPLIKTIVFLKSPGKSLGFSICGGKGSARGDDILVRNIDLTGPAAQDGRLKIGDEIVEVNSQQLKGCTHQEAAGIIKGLKSDVITLVVRSSTTVKRSSSIRGTEMEIVLEKLPKKPLGIQLAEVQERDRCAVFIRKMAPGSTAETSGKLVLFDQIVRVNGDSVLDMRTHEVRSALTNAPTGELRVGVVRPKDPAVVEKAITKQEKLKKTVSSPAKSKTSGTTPTPGAVSSGLFVGESDTEERLSGSELDNEEMMNTDDNAYVARSRLLPRPPRFSLDDALSLQQDLSAVKAFNQQLRDRTREKRASTNGSPPSRSSPPSRGSPLPRSPHVTDITPPQGFTQLELTLKKPQRSRLGINIVECKGSVKDLFMIRRIMPGGVAARDGRLKLGDLLVNLNGKSLRGLSLAKVLQEINDVSKYCHFVIWRDPSFTLIPSHGGSRASLASIEDETKRGDGKRHMSLSSPLSGNKRLSLDISNSPIKARRSLTLSARENSPLRIKRWSTAEGVKVDHGDIDTSSLEKYFPLTPSTDNKSSGSVTPVPSLPDEQPPSLPGTPAPTPPDTQTPPNTPPLLLSEPPCEVLILATSSPPMELAEVVRPVSLSQEDEPQPPSSLPPVEDEPQPPSSLPPTEDEPQPPSSLPPTEDEPQPPSSLPPTEDEPQPPSSLPPTEDEPQPPSSLPPTEDEPQPPSSLPPTEDGPQPPSSLPPTEDEPQPPSSLPPTEDGPQPPSSLPPTEDEPQPPSSLPPTEDEPQPPSSLPPTEDEPQPPSSLPPTEDEPQPPSSLPPTEDEPQPPSSLPPTEDEPQPPSSLPPTEDEPQSLLPEEPKNLPEVEQKLSEEVSKSKTEELPLVPSTPPPVPEPSGQSDLSIPKDKRQDSGPFEITLYKSMFGLGLHLLTDKMGMTAIKKMDKWSAMAKSGNFKAGDQILSVNDTPFIGKKLSECEYFLKSLPKGQVKFVVMAPPKDVTGGGLQSESSMYTGVAVSRSGRQLVTEEGVVKAELNCYGKNSIGLEVEGGMDTPLQYVYISHLVPGSPAFESGVFRKGDQLVMVGEECMIGLTHTEALGVIRKAKEIVEVVAQRKESPKQTRKPDPVQTSSNSTKELPKQTHKPSPATPIPDLPSSDSKKESPSEQILKTSTPTSPIPDLIITESDSPEESPKQTHQPTSPVISLDSHSDTETPVSVPEVKPSVQPGSQYRSSTSISSIPELEPTSFLPGSDRQLSDNRYASLDKGLHSTSPPHTSHSNKALSASDLRRSPEDVSGTFGAVPEETLTIELHRSASEKMGLAITGGSDNPRLPEIHVKQVVPDCVAHKDGRLKRGDRIVSVNGQSLAGLSNKEALKILKEAGLSVTLVIARKIGRRTSTMTTPYMSHLQSRKGSGDNSQQGSKAGSRQGSPPSARRHRQSSGENSRGGSKGSSPKTSVRRNTHSQRRRDSVSAGDKGESRTLPRQLSSTIGVKLVELHKGPTGIGMQLHGGKEGANVPITVKSVFPGGSAYKCGKIHKGDVILEANGISFEGLSHDQALATMKGFPQGKITLIMRDRSVAGRH